jgi:hypothetical protein
LASNKLTRGAKTVIESLMVGISWQGWNTKTIVDLGIADNAADAIKIISLDPYLKIHIRDGLYTFNIYKFGMWESRYIAGGSEESVKKAIQNIFQTTIS